MINPKISVVMAVFNGERYLKPTIETILSQTFKNFELIIVNDGSTDGTKDIIKRYHDNRVLLINNSENRGQTASLNIGLQNARGIYVARTDAGDISAPERFHRQFRYLETHPDVDILGTAAVQYDMSGNLCGTVFMPNRPATILQRIFFACPVVHVSVMMRRERVIQLGGYDNSYRILADYGLWARALQKGLKFWNLKDVLTGYLVNPDSFGASHGQGRSIQEASRIICELVFGLTGDRLSLDKAEAIYRFFVFGPQDLDVGQAQETANLFEALLIKINIPRRDIDYLYLRSYLKMLFRECSSIHRQEPKIEFNLKKILGRWRGVLSVQLFQDINTAVRSFMHQFISSKEDRRLLSFVKM